MTFPFFSMYLLYINKHYPKADFLGGISMLPKAWGATISWLVHCAPLIRYQVLSLTAYRPPRSYLYRHTLRGISNMDTPCNENF